MKKKMQRMKLTPLPMHKRSVPVQVLLNDEKLPKKPKRFVELRFVESVTYSIMEIGMKASNTVANKKGTKTLNIQLMN